MCLLQIGGNNKYLSLQVLEKISADLPTPGDVRMEICLKLGEFKGRYANVWLAQSDIATFVNQLGALESTRQGSSKLNAMSSEEFHLELCSIDTLGHCKAVVHLGQYQKIGSTRSLTHLTGQLEVEPNQLPVSLAFFQSLLLTS